MSVPFMVSIARLAVAESGISMKQYLAALPFRSTAIRTFTDCPTSLKSRSSCWSSGTLSIFEKGWYCFTPSISLMCPNAMATRLRQTSDRLQRRTIIKSTTSRSRPQRVNRLVEIANGKDAVVLRCSHRGCRDVIPVCILKLSDRCSTTFKSAKWHHISCDEHYCQCCYDCYTQKSGLRKVNDWRRLWKLNGGKALPSIKLFIAEGQKEMLHIVLFAKEGGSESQNLCEKVLPYWIHRVISPTDDGQDPCSVAEDPVARRALVSYWFKYLAVPPLLKNSPAAVFLKKEYYFDLLGMSPTMSVSVEQNARPFYMATDYDRARCFRPDAMEPDEIKAFPEYESEQNFYLCLRNLIVALWNLNPSNWITPADCKKKIICRGLIRILLTHEVGRILQFLTHQGLVNFGLLKNPPNCFSIAPKKMSVVVVGAGISGIAAARQLQNFGVNVVVLEIKEKAGGRIVDDCSFGVPVGRGGQLITGIINNPFCVLCFQAGINFRVLREECPLISERTGKIVNHDVDRQVECHFNALLDVIEHWQRRALMKKVDRCYSAHKCGSSLESVDEEELFNFHISNLEYSCGSPLEMVSGLHWNQNEKFPQFAGSHALMTAGCARITDQLVEGLDVRYCKKVVGIDYSSEQVKVCTADEETFICDKVIVTVPLAVLKKECIEFLPALPDNKLKAISTLGCGIIEKIALRFSKNFWSKKTNAADYFGSVSSKGQQRGFFNVFYDFTPPGSSDDETCNVLMCYLSGESAQLIHSKTDEAIVDLCVQTLRKMFPEEDIPEPMKYMVTRWGQDPDIGMAYSYICVGATGDDYDAMAETVKGKVHFAGEATSRQFPQTFTGALVSGLREASKILDIHLSILLGFLESDHHQLFLRAFVSWTRGGEARRKNLSAPKINQPTGAGGKSNGRLIEKNRHCVVVVTGWLVSRAAAATAAATTAAATANSSRVSALTNIHTYTREKKNQRYRKVVGWLVFSVLCTLLAKVDWIVCIGSKKKERRRRREQKSSNIPRIYIGRRRFFLGREIFYNFEQQKGTNQAGSSGVVQSIAPPPLCSRF
ncbi:Lysine-specific histone demethylase 1B [Trichinella nativa]|uniref:Lysine-specific histone demethylase 1B n=1 Tax=Trichinella nativa TaxID=6335 RepID=A0A0V1LIE5_9BILA|nr:Lysine-specific histone demethylase 1B [Trichinella nativa]